MLLSFLIEFARQFLWAFAASAPYLLLGLLAAGLLRVFVPDELLVRMLGRSRSRSVVLAAVLGVPLPICSCGIVPLSLTMRRKGAGRGATMSFLISTPETGVPSIALTWGLLGPLMAVARPLVALVTSLVAGLAIELSDDEAGDDEEALPDEPDEPDASSCGTDGCCDDACRAGTTDEDGATGEPGAPTSAPAASARAQMTTALRYGFGELLGEIAPWLLLGLLLTGFVGALLPDQLLADRAVGSGLPAMLLAIVVGVPLYMCASGSTPLAAALVAKGLSPGAALVFLMSGPATNVATITMVRRFYGARFLRIYLASIAAVAIGAGLALDGLIGVFGWTVWSQVGSELGAGLGAIEWIGAVVLAVLIAWVVRKTGVRAQLAELREGSLALALLVGGVRSGPRPGRRAALALAVVAGLVWLGQGVVIVRPGEQAVVRRFGVPRSSALDPGLHLRLPPPLERVDVCLTGRVRVLELGFRERDGYRLREPQVARELDLIAGDENLVDITATVAFRALDAEAYLYRLDDPDGLVRHATITAISQTLLDRRIDEVLTTDRDAIQGQALATAQSMLDEYGAGVELLALHILTAHAPPQVHDAFREVASAQEDSATYVNEAIGDRDALLAEARGEAARTLDEAHAAALDERARAAGEAQAFAQLAAAARRAPRATRTRLYLEALERVLPGRRKVVRPGSGTFELWLVPGSGAVADDDGGTRIQVPVIPQRPGDPDSVEVDLDAGLPDFGPGARR